jgi:hypothetical protein
MVLAEIAKSRAALEVCFFHVYICAAVRRFLVLNALETAHSAMPRRQIAASTSGKFSKCNYSSSNRSPLSWKRAKRLSLTVRALISSEVERHQEVVQAVAVQA